ncbi:FixH family protein [Blattabacterium cuenoti]|uniref:FixH family protein n=1 Tax=Blattabacterium cuenoti TaxID=1653831 RepID=UPI00163C2941|nr:FixH family protein [Blattabacterium cuenoti]
MKIKLGWDTSIILSMVTFMSFIIYIAFFFPNIESQLVSEKYYEDELKYQEIINEKKNASKLSDKINILTSSTGINIIFHISNGYGSIKLFRYSSKDLDLIRYFDLSTRKKLFINKKFLKKGYYKVIIRFKNNKVKYFIEKNLYWNK